MVGQLLPNGYFRIDGYLTHGSSPTLGSVPLLPFTMDPNFIKQGSQNFIAFEKAVIIINSTWLKSTIQGAL